MIDRTERCFALRPKRRAADTAYGTGKFLGWLVNDKNITPHIPVWERSGRADGAPGTRRARFRVMFTKMPAMWPAAR
jgi:hypothetical protein